MRKFILTNLTDTNNGFARRAKIRTLDNGKKLLLANRGIGIFFNNKMG